MATRHAHRWIGAAVVTCAAGSACAMPPLFFGATLGGAQTTSGGVTLPPGQLWSELPTPASVVQGFLADTDSGARLADDFLVTDAGGWSVTHVQVYAYQPGAKPTDQPFITASVRIWNGPPGDPHSTVVAQSSTQAPAATFSGVFRTDRRGVQSRPVFAVAIPIRVDLPMGRYWADWSLTGKYGSGVWSPATTVVGALSAPGANGRRYLGGTWDAAVETIGDDLESVPQGFPMVVLGYVTGTSPTCYANCDGSTTPPVLEFGDFACFLQRFALGSPYANCDESTWDPLESTCRHASLSIL